MEKQTNQARQILNLFKSRAVAAEAAGGIKGSTVDTWAVRGIIPEPIKLHMLENCEKHGVSKTEMFAVMIAPYMDRMRA